MKRLFTRLIQMDQWMDQKIQTLSSANSVPFFKVISKEISFIFAFCIPIIGMLLDTATPWAWVWIAGLASYVSTRWMKRLTGRKRPQEQTQTSVHLDGETGSFPSRHVAVFAAQGAFLLLSGSQFAIVWFAGLVFVAVSRLGLREHFFSDVAVGLFWGLLNGWLVEMIKGVVTA